MPSAGGTAARRRRLAAGPLSVAAHLALLLGFVAGQPEPPATAEPEPMSVRLVDPPPPPPAPEPASVPEDRPDAPAPDPPAAKAVTKAASKTPTPKPPARQVVAARPAPPSPDVAPVPAAPNAGTQGIAALSDGEIAGAARAGPGGGGGSGAGGGSCDMLRRLQDALRKDRRVQTAVAEAQRGRPLLVWNGEWVRHADQEGEGLAAVREAILWEVGFAPPACRAQAVRGLVLISLSDRPGSSRLVLGSSAWRWSDLVRSRSRQLQR